MLTRPVAADEGDRSQVVPIEPLGDAFVISDADVGDEPVARVGVAGASVDPVKDYLQQIGRVPLLTAEQEVELAIRIEAGLFAAERLNSDAVLDQQLRGDLERIAEDGQRAKDRMMEANLRLAVSLAKRHTGGGMPFLDLIQEECDPTTSPGRGSAQGLAEEAVPVEVGP